ncbi:MAG: glycyl-radical enzyme activating protein [Desulfobacteraceae bacterium]|nr:glycyl-radical enzyme activating protein [Desulfobacteraceae bacterium]
MFNTTGNIFKIQKYAIHDGPGIRTTVFLKGCPLSCRWCHNPEGIPAGGNPGGRSVTPEEVMGEIAKDIIFYDESGGGATFSGGEPLAQVKFLLALLEQCAALGIHTTVDTTGFAQPATIAAVAELADLFLFDLKLMDDAMHRRVTGVSNAVILENLRHLSGLKKKIRIRFPLIPTITDADDNIENMVRFVRSLETIGHIDILPFHDIAAAKYQRLGLEDKMNGITPPDDDSVNRVKAYLELSGFNVRIGG